MLTGGSDLYPFTVHWLVGALHARLSPMGARLTRTRKGSWHAKLQEDVLVRLNPDGARLTQESVWSTEVIAEWTMFCEWFLLPIE